MLKKQIPDSAYQKGAGVLHSLEFMVKLAESALVNAKYSGQLQTALKTKPCNGAGQPFTWYSPPMNDFLNAFDFRNYSVLEFGAGHSTLWWSRRAKTVCAVEDHDDWFEYLSQRAGSNVELIHVTDNPQIAYDQVRDRKFDLIVVDCNDGALDRNVCNEWATELMADNGAIIFDNSEVDVYGQKSIPMYQEKGFSRVDFYGIAATMTAPQCSSVLFRNNCFLWKGEHMPRKMLEFDATTIENPM